MLDILLLHQSMTILRMFIIVVDGQTKLQRGTLVTGIWFWSCRSCGSVMASMVALVIMGSNRLLDWDILKLTLAPKSTQPKMGT